MIVYPKEGKVVKKAKKILSALSIIAGCTFFLCTINNDNGNPAVTGPGTTTKPVTKPTVPPSLVVILDSAYIGIDETLGIAVWARVQDSLPLRNAPIVFFPSSGWLSDDTVRTDADGRAVTRFSGSKKSQVTLIVSCYGTADTVFFDVTDAPDRIQKSIKILPANSILKADGKDNTAVRVTLRNENNNPIVGECVQFITTTGTITAGSGGCTQPGQSVTDGNGVAEAALTSENQNDTAFITAFLVSDRAKSAETKVVFKGVTIKLAVDSTNFKIGGQTAVIASLLNGSNEPIPYVPIFFSLGRDSLSNLSLISADTVTGADGKALALIRGNRTGADSIRVRAAGALSTTKITVTDMQLEITLSDRVLQARESDSTILHVTLLDKGNNGVSKDIKIREYFQKRDGTDTSTLLLTQTDAEGKCGVPIFALPYEGAMRIEAVAFDNSGDLASAVTTLNFITTRNMTIYSLPTVIQADGTSKSTITVQIKNKENNPVVGDAIKFVTDAGMITGSSITDASGKAIAYLTSDRRNTIVTVVATLVKDPTKTVDVKVEFSGVNLTAAANPATINSSGKDSSLLTTSLLDAANNPIVGEKINFYPRHSDFTHLSVIDSVTNNRGEARCKVYGTGVGYDTISIKAAGAVTQAIIGYSSNFLVIDTPSWQPCYANGKDSTRVRITYRQGDKTTPIQNAELNASVTIGSMNADPVFTKTYTLKPEDNGQIYFYIKNPNFANTATITVSAKTASEITSARYQIYFRALKIKRIELLGTPEVIAVNNGTKANQAKLVGIAYDSMDNRVQGELVAFNLVHGPGGGEYLDPPTAITDAGGTVTTYVISGSTPSRFRDVWVAAGDLSAIKSDTIKFTIAGPPRDITIRTNLTSGTDFKDGTYGLPCAAIVTDVNGNPVADGTEVTFSLRISGWRFRTPIARFDPVEYTNSYRVYIDTGWTYLPVEDFNNNLRLDPGEDRDGDGVASRGEDLDGDGLLITGPTYEDINQNGRRDYLPEDVVEPEIWSWVRDSTGAVNWKPFYADFNHNLMRDSIEPLTGLYANMTDDEYTAELQKYKAAHHGMGFDIDLDPVNGIPDPRTAVSIVRTVQTAGGKAINNVLYGQSDAWKIEIMIWAESQGIKTTSPAQLVLPVIK